VSNASICTFICYPKVKAVLDEVVDAAAGDAAADVPHDDTVEDDVAEYCPICSERVAMSATSNDVTAAQGICYRLESCGHAYCLDCLLEQVKQCDVPMICHAVVSYESSSKSWDISLVS
jgi:hypothetical protein